MIDTLLILSDIHGNLTALESVLSDITDRGLDAEAIVILGDNINYGMRPNEVVEQLLRLQTDHRVIVNIFGNHEKALLDGDTDRFSTERGKQILDYTRSIISESTLQYLKGLIREGMCEMEINNKKFLFVHGSYNDPYWGKMNYEEINKSLYSKYDYVISGHSHIPHLIEHFYSVESSEYRNKKRTIFLNPGSVGQPRNHNPRAQYLYIDISTENFQFNSVSYSVDAEQALYDDKVDLFYSERLTLGI